MKAFIFKVPVDGTVTIYGHQFHGIEEIEAAVEVKARTQPDYFKDLCIRRLTPSRPVPGLHVLKLYQPYPCFDEFDEANEDRDYCNYFFSMGGFSDERIACFASKNKMCNSCMVYEDMNPDLIPAVYFSGEKHYPLVVATIAPE